MYCFERSMYGFWCSHILRPRGYAKETISDAFLLDFFLKVHTYEKFSFENHRSIVIFLGWQNDQTA